MQAWRPQGGALAPIDVELPAPGPDQVEVEIEAAVLGAPERAATASDRTPGGAAVGVVRACGENATHLQDVRVLVGPRAPCGECDLCRRGAAVVCKRGSLLGSDADGLLAERALAPARWVCPLVDGLALPGPAAAAVAREAADAYAMFVTAGVGPGEPVIICGDGPRSRLLVDVAVARGTQPIRVHDVTDDALLAHVRRAAEELQLGERPWRVFDAEADAPGRRRALALAEPAATLVMFAGTEAAGVQADPDLLATRGCRLLGIAGAHPDLLTEVAALAAEGDIDLSKRVDVRSPERINQPLPTDRVVVIELR